MFVTDDVLNVEFDHDLVEQKMEREKLEKERRKADKDKADAAKRAAAAKGDKVKLKTNQISRLDLLQLIWLISGL